MSSRPFVIKSQVADRARPAPVALPVRRSESIYRIAAGVCLAPREMLGWLKRGGPSMRSVIAAGFAIGALTLTSPIAAASDEQSPTVKSATEQTEASVDLTKVEFTAPTTDARAERRAAARRARVEQASASAASSNSVANVAEPVRFPERKISQIWLWMGF